MAREGVVMRFRFFLSPQCEGGCWDLEARKNVCLLGTEGGKQRKVFLNMSNFILPGTLSRGRRVILEPIFLMESQPLLTPLPTLSSSEPCRIRRVPNPQEASELVKRCLNVSAVYRCVLDSSWRQCLKLTLKKGSESEGPQSCCASEV